MDLLGLWLDFGLAWVAVALALALCVIFLLRRIRKNNNALSKAVTTLNRFLRRYHIVLGIVLIAVGLVHGLFSTQSVLSLNIGTGCWIVSLLLGLNWLLRKKLPAYKGWIYYHRILTAAFLALIVWHVVDVGGIQAPQALFGGQDTTTVQLDQQRQEDGETADAAGEDAAVTEGDSSTASFNGAQLRDGTYTGEATGYRPGLQVSVTIENNTITSVEVIEHNEENSRYYSRPISIVPEEIVEEQSTDVDTVSSGTFTSIGIMNAVNDALRQALISGELPVDLALPATRHRH